MFPIIDFLPLPHNNFDILMYLIFKILFIATGNNYSISWTVYNLGSNGTCNTISVVDVTGAVISSYTALKYDSDPISICSTDIDLPEQVTLKVL